MHSTDKNLVKGVRLEEEEERAYHQKHWRCLAMTIGNRRFEYFWLKDLLPRSGLSSSISFALSIINPKVASLKLLSPANLIRVQAYTCSLSIFTGFYNSQ